MLRIKLYKGSKAMEHYLNKKSNKQYKLETITTYGLFEPLRLDACYFKKTPVKNRIYRVDSGKVSEADFNEYKQIFIDDGWNFFGKNYVNDQFNADHIFYSDDPRKHDIFSDDESERKRNRDNAVMGLYKGTVLCIIFILFSVFFPSVNAGSSHTFIGFILHNLYIIVAVLIMFVSLIRYIKNK